MVCESIYHCWDSIATGDNSNCQKWHSLLLAADLIGSFRPVSHVSIYCTCEEQCQVLGPRYDSTMMLLGKHPITLQPEHTCTAH